MKDNGKIKKLLLIIIAVVVIAIIALAALSGFITDYLWFNDLSYSDVFWKQLLTELKIGVPTFIVVTFLGIIYLRAIRRGYKKRVSISEETMGDKGQKRVGNVIAILASLIVTYMATSTLWFKSLQFTHAQPFGIKDPIFGNDISFYVFKLSFVKDLNTTVIVAIVLFALITFIYYFFLLSVLKPELIDGEPVEEGEAPKQQGPGMQEFMRAFGIDIDAGGGRNYAAGPQQQSSAGMKDLIHIASKQITVIGVIFFLMLAVYFFLAQFDLLYSTNGIVYGAGYTDIHITLWMYRIVIVLSVIAAIMFGVGIKTRKVKTAIILPVIMIAVGIVGGIAGLVVQNLVVSPNEINMEETYLANNIKYTQSAYDLRDVSINQFPAQNDLTSEEVKANMDTIKNIRINDYDPTKTYYNNSQSIRRYYTFNDVDVDRYMINGEYTQTFLSAREIDESKIPQQWMNLHLKYTHGYGVTLSRVDKVTASGQPDMLIKNIPPESQVEEIDISRPEIYFGELQNEYIITNTDEKEFDYPEGDSNKYSTYEGDHGISLSPLNKLMFALREQSMKLLVSSNIDSNSKIIINRNIAERVRYIMPFVDYADPYMVTVDGKLYWIIDGFTTSELYPYSEPYNTDQGGATNYIRNSVKVVIDAYTGATEYYLVDDKDPVSNTLKGIYPTLFKSIDKLNDGIRAHIRYPGTMLNIQANIYKKYHVNDIGVFYQSEDLWDIANEKLGASDRETPMTPNYYIMKLPGENDVEFVNSIPYTPMNKVNMTGLLIARNDGEHYGELMLLQLPKGKITMGPSQIDAQIAQDTQISQDFALWENSGSMYSRGNMFVVPIEDSIMYVEPIYLKAVDSSMPEVKRIIIYYNDKIAYGSTLADALDTTFGKGTGDEVRTSQPTGDTGDADSTPSDTDVEGQPDSNTTEGTGVTDATGSGSAIGTEGDAQQMTTDELVKAIADTYNRATEAQRNGDWAKYGEEMALLETYINQLNQ
ncbi:MAG: UPF0182 family protein [Clostridiales Family XIII bacterium]|jgi:uncharacterized membrane protein (UPF0182 family)|nr:UPF0182 family protein [Clostridiales Family XIII bacterium]